jgi:hypothetical protein
MNTFRILASLMNTVGFLKVVLVVNSEFSPCHIQHTRWGLLYDAWHRHGQVCCGMQLSALDWTVQHSRHMKTVKGQKLHK